MHNSKMAWFRAIMFLVIFVILNEIIIFAVVPKSTQPRSVLKEMYAKTTNADMVFAGSSYSVRGINPYIMDEKLNCSTMDYSFDSQRYLGTYCSLKELFKYQKPKLVILNTDIMNYIANSEDRSSYVRVAPYIKSLSSKIQFFEGFTQEGFYLDKIFIWRPVYLSSISSILSNIKGKMDPNYINYPTQTILDSYKKSDSGYVGKGFLKMDAKDSKNVLNDNKLGVMKITNTDLNQIKSKNVEYFKMIVNLCKENNAELILIQTPLPTHRMFKEKNYFKFSEKIGEIAKEQGIDYYDYNLIKPEIFKSKSEYFIDEYHLNSNGADEFSYSLAEFLKLRSSGEDMSKYFYTSEEYINSINYITNTWFTNKISGNKIDIKADSFHGGQVTPEYQFVLIDPKSDKSTVIRDYKIDPNLTIEKPVLSDYKIRVNTREVGSKVKYSHYYEQEFKK